MKNFIDSNSKNIFQEIESPAEKKWFVLGLSIRFLVVTSTDENLLHEVSTCSRDIKQATEGEGREKTFSWESCFFDRTFHIIILGNTTFRSVQSISPHYTSSS